MWFSLCFFKEIFAESGPPQTLWKRVQCSPIWRSWLSDRGSPRAQVLGSRSSPARTSYTPALNMSSTSALLLRLVPSCCPTPLWSHPHLPHQHSLCLSTMCPVGPRSSTMLERTYDKGFTPRRFIDKTSSVSLQEYFYLDNSLKNVEFLQRN